MSDRLEREWERHRPAVFGAAYRILGSVADAEDVVQDVWLRAANTALDDVRDLRAWLVTVAARRSYDLLTSARARRESYVGPWLPEPLLTGPDAAEPELLDPDAVYITDGGGKVFAARKAIRGGARIADTMLRLVRSLGRSTFVPAEVNGEPGLLTYRDGRLVAVDTVEVCAGRIVEYRRQLNPDKLAGVRRLREV